jgi:hypothetical protein
VPQIHNILHVISSFNNYYSLAQAIALLLHYGLSCTFIAYCLIAPSGENWYLNHISSLLANDFFLLVAHYPAALTRWLC